MSAPKGTAWSDEDARRAREMWDVHGMSARAIAAALGRSRNSVISKVRRGDGARRAPQRKDLPPPSQRVTSSQAKALVQSFSVPDTRSMTARIFGDPLPGRSALDARRKSELNKNERICAQVGNFSPEPLASEYMEDRLAIGRTV